jgi:excisionase family DNA binding protein
MGSPSFYSPEDVARLLGLHVRTVRGYVRSGRLPATRIGKQYRITEQDLRQFTGGRLPATEPHSARLHVSAVVHIDHADRQVLDRVSGHAGAAATRGTEAGPGVGVHTLYDESMEKLTVILAGRADAVAGMLTLISALVEEDRR